MMFMLVNDRSGHKIGKPSIENLKLFKTDIPWWLHGFLFDFSDRDLKDVRLV